MNNIIQIDAEGELGWDPELIGPRDPILITTIIPDYKNVISVAAHQNYSLFLTNDNIVHYNGNKKRGFGRELA